MGTMGALLLIASLLVGVYATRSIRTMLLNSVAYFLFDWRVVILRKRVAFDRRHDPGLFWVAILINALAASITLSMPLVFVMITLFYLVKHLVRIFST